MSDGPGTPEQQLAAAQGVMDALPDAKRPAVTRPLRWLVRRVCCSAGGDGVGVCERVFVAVGAVGAALEDLAGVHAHRFDGRAIFVGDVGQDDRLAWQDRRDQLAVVRDRQDVGHRLDDGGWCVTTGCRCVAEPRNALARLPAAGRATGWLPGGGSLRRGGGSSG